MGTGRWMTGEYKTLARLFHADRSNDAFAHHERLARMRLEADSTFRTAIVTPLGEPFVAMPRSLSMVMERILLDENTISALWQGIPGVMRWDYIRHAISAEIFATNEMEGVRSTRKEVEDAVDAARAEAGGSDAAPHKRATTGRRGSSAKRRRFVEFARLYLGLAEGSRPAENTRPADAAGSAEGSRPAETASSRTPRTLEDIRGIYDRVTHGEVDQDGAPDGALFRARDVDIVGPHGDAIHTGVNGEARISVMLTQMIDLVASDSMPGIIAAIVAHFLFEYIHPFYDGNGRTGRFLFALDLNSELSLPTVLSLSRTIAQNKEAYYKAFSQAEDRLNCGELTFFVMTMLDLIGTAQHDVIAELGVKNDRLAKAKALCDELRDEHGLSRGASEILFQVMQEQLFDSRTSVSLRDAAAQIGLSKQSARKYVAELEDTGLIAFTGRRPLRFIASEPVRARLDGEV